MSVQEEYQPQVGMARNVQARSNMLNGVDRILDKPRVRVATAAAQSIPNASTTTAITWIVVPYDTDGFFDTALPTRVTIRTQGAYDVKQFVFYGGNAAGAARQSWVGVNGATNRYAYDQRAPNANFGRVGASDTILLNAGDYLEVFAYQDSGGALALQSVASTYNSAELNVTLLSTAN